MDSLVEEQSRGLQDEASTHDLSAANGKIINGEDEQNSDHQFQRAISAWRGTSSNQSLSKRHAECHQAIDLGSLVPQLDKTAADVVENQKDALVQRKELAQKTKDYRKLDDADKLTEWKLLLKGMAVDGSHLDWAELILSSLPEFCRPAHKSRKDNLKCLPPGLLFHIGGT